MTKNNKFMIMGLLGVALFGGCQKYDGDSYDFAQKDQNYIRFTADQSLVFNAETADSIIGDDTFFYFVEDSQPLSVETRVGFTEPVTFIYTLETDNGISEEHTGTIPAQSTTGAIELSFPADRFGPADSVVTGTYTLKSATGQYGDLRVGYPQASAGSQVSFVANKPNVLYPK